MTPDARVQEIRERFWRILDRQQILNPQEEHERLNWLDDIRDLLSALDARERRIEELEAKVADSWFEACAKERDEAHTLLGRLVEALEWYHMAGCTTHHQGGIACDALTDARRALGEP